MKKKTTEAPPAKSSDPSKAAKKKNTVREASLVKKNATKKKESSSGKPKQKSPGSKKGNNQRVQTADKIQAPGENQAPVKEKEAEKDFLAGQVTKDDFFKNKIGSATSRSSPKNTTKPTRSAARSKSYAQVPLTGSQLNSTSLKTNAMAYTNIQFIAYQLTTAPANAVFAPDGRLIGGNYLGLADINEDIQQRCQLMLDAVNAAAETLNNPNDPAVLKVFMVPEFAFRGPAGAYTMDQVQTVISTLQNTFVGAQWQNWMFVFGTIVGYTEIDNDALKAVLSDTYNRPINSFYEIYNVTLVQNGGYTDVANAPGMANVVMKENMSTIDFIMAPEMGMDWAIGYLLSGAPSGPGKEFQIVNYDGLGMFQANELTFGLEICLDHLSGRLNASPAMTNQPMVQVQLVPACGATLQQNAIVAQSDGYAFNVNGIGPATSVARSVTSAFPIASVNKAITVSPGVDVNALYAQGAGLVCIYNPVLLPAQRYVTGSGNNYRYEDDYVLYSFNIWYTQAGNTFTFDIAYCSMYLKTLDVTILWTALPVTNATIGNRVGLSCSVVNVVDPVTGYDRGIWMDLAVDYYHFTGVIVTFPSVYKA